MKVHKNTLKKLKRIQNGHKCQYCGEDVDIVQGLPVLEKGTHRKHVCKNKEYEEFLKKHKLGDTQVY